LRIESLNDNLNQYSEQRMNKTIILLVVVAIFAVSLIAIFLADPWLTAPQNQQELGFTVSGTNECLRFLNATVQTAYVPFRTGPNEQWQLTIECAESSGASVWTDVYIYNGYWDGGRDNTCLSQDLYPLLDQIESADFRIKTNSNFTRIFGESTQQSYTIFFVFPPGGTSTFNVKLDQLS
jgi:hypothetical protein